MAGQQAGNDKASAGRFRWLAILLPVALLAVGLVFALADDAPSAEAHEVEATQTTTECVDLVYGYPSTRICWPLTKTYPVPHSHPTPKPTPQPTPKPCTSLFCGMTQAEICAAAGLRVHPSGTGCGPTPTPTPQPTCEHGIDPGTGNCATAIPLPTPTPQPTCEHGIDPGTGNCATAIPLPTPTPQPTCEHGIDPGTGNCATAIPLPTPTPQPTCEHGIDPGTGNCATAIPLPTPTPQPTCEHGIDPGTGNCATAIPLPTPTPQPTCEHGIDPGTGNCATAIPLPTPTPQPTAQPTVQPTPQPTAQPTVQPTPQPTAQPTVQPTPQPTAQPTVQPTPQPTAQPTVQPTPQPTAQPTVQPTPQPTAQPTVQPTPQPTAQPTVQATQEPDDNDDGKDDNSGGTPDDEECSEGRKRHPATKGCYPTPTTYNDDADNSDGDDTMPTMPEINIPPEGVTCPAGYQYGSGSLGSSPPYAAPSGKFWNSVKASVPVFPAHTCWQFRSGGCPAGTIMAMARYSTTPNRLLTGYEEGHLPEAPDGKKWTHTVANADYACYRLVEKPTAPSPFDYVIGVLRETGRTTMTATARLGVAAESFIRSLGRGTEYFISGLGRVTYSVVCNFIGGAFVTEEAGRTAAQRLAVRVARDVAVAVRAVTTATTGLALYAACIAFPIDSDNSDDDTDDSTNDDTDDSTNDDTDDSTNDDTDDSTNDDTDDSTNDDTDDSTNDDTDDSTNDDTSTDPTENGDVSNSQLRDAFSDGYWFSYENGPGCSVLGVGRSTDRIVYKCPDS